MAALFHSPASSRVRSFVLNITRRTNEASLLCCPAVTIPDSKATRCLCSNSDSTNTVLSLPSRSRPTLLTLILSLLPPSLLAPIIMADYASFKVPELKKLLSDRGLPIAGNKADLIARLQENDSTGKAKGTQLPSHPRRCESIARAAPTPYLFTC